MSSQQPKQSSTSASSQSQSPTSPFSVPVLIAITAILAIVASFFAKFSPFSFSLPAAIAGSREVVTRVVHSSSVGSTAGQKRMMSLRTPVYFWGHGGPNIMYDYDHPAYRAIQKVGKEITTKVKPKAVIVLSGHWQAKKDEVQINTAEITDLIYDFYGFPSHYYKETYPNVGSKEVAEKVMTAVRSAGLNISGVKRGLDHGVWSSFKIAFDHDDNPLNVPLVQLSLYGNEDPLKHFKLGAALAPLREEGIVIIASGMAVHNLRDYMLSTSRRPLPYTASFDEAMKEAATAPFEDGQREKAVVELVKRVDARQSHPHMDHLMPFHVAAGAAAEDKGKQLFTFWESSMSWAQYRWGDVPAKI